MKQMLDIVGSISFKAGVSGKLFRASINPKGKSPAMTAVMDVVYSDPPPITMFPGMSFQAPSEFMGIDLSLRGVEYTLETMLPGDPVEVLARWLHARFGMHTPWTDSPDLQESFREHARALLTERPGL